MTLDTEPPGPDNTIVQVFPVKKKTPGSRSWMRFDSSGVSEFLELDRNAILKHASIPSRDLRTLNPIFSQSSHILARERAMLVNLEYVKAIVTAEELFLLDATSPVVVPFVEQLKKQFPLKSPSQKDQQDPVNRRSTSIISRLSPEPDQQDFVNVTISEDPALDALVEWSSVGNSKELPDGQLPFEFRVLEIALDMVCNYLEGRVTELELKAYPRLDESTRHITSVNLQLVQSLKSVLKKLTARVKRVRDELEHLLDDYDDMADLYLTRKRARDQHIDSPSTSIRVDGRIVKSNRADSANLGDKDVEELEMLLEEYFMQLDGTLNRLMTIREYIDDTEDYISIQLDSQRNQLRQFQIMLLIWSLAMGIGGGVLGLVSMNIKIPIEYNRHAFIPFVMGVLTLIAGLFSLGVMYMYRKDLFVT